MNYIKTLIELKIKGDPIEVGAVLQEEAPKYGITTVEDAAKFVANCLVETKEYTEFSEDLFYRTASLLPSRYSIFKAPSKYNPADYLKNPEKLANLVYMDNVSGRTLGNTQPGDGFKFLGAGDLQITGRNNFISITKHNKSGIDFLNNPQLAKQGAGRRIASLAWWLANNGTKCATFKDSRRLVNGRAMLGLAEGQKYYDKILQINAK